MEKKIVFTQIGATRSASERHENDFYATDPKALESFLNDSKINLTDVWECACGEGHLAEVLRQKNILSKASDLVDRGYGDTGVNFFYLSEVWQGDILTNPPYNEALKFCKHAIDCIDEGRFVVMLMRIQFLEGKKRKDFFKNHPPKFVYVSSSRLLLAKNGDFKKYNKPSANAYAWYVWQKGFNGETTLKWFN